LNLPPPPFSFISPPPIPGIVSTGLIFCINIHVYTFLHCVHPFTPLPHYLLPIKTFLK
jgi:hypothetical protein